MARTVLIGFPTKYFRMKSAASLVAFPTNRSTGARFASVKLPPGTRLATTEDPDVDASFFELTASLERVFLPFGTDLDAAVGRLSEVYVAFDPLARDGTERIVRMHRDMGDYQDDGSFLGHPVRIEVTVDELSRAMSKRHEDECVQEEDVWQDRVSGDTPERDMDESRREAAARARNKR